MKIKKTWISEGELETLKNLFSRCKNENFIKFLKENFDECFPVQYFENFGWIKFRFDDLKYDFENGNDLFANQKTYPVFGVEEDSIDLYDWDLSNGCEKDDDKQKTLFIKKEELQPVLKNKRVTQTQIAKDNNLKKDLDIIINNFDELIPAMKCLLWTMNNQAQTIKKLFSHIYILENDNKRAIQTGDYEITNELIKQATKQRLIHLEKTSTEGKNVFLYKNPSNKRQGYFYEGKLRSLDDLVIISGIGRSTLSMRLRKMNTLKALNKEV